MVEQGRSVPAPVGADRTKAARALPRVVHGTMSPSRDSTGGFADGNVLSGPTSLDTPLNVA